MLVPLFKNTELAQFQPWKNLSCVWQIQNERDKKKVGSKVVCKALKLLDFLCCVY